MTRLPSLGKRTLAALTALLLGALQAGAQPSDASPGERVAWFFLDNVVRVVAENLDGTEQSEGFGFVFGQRANELYIATADHVVRNDEEKPARSVHVIFFRDQGRPAEARLLDLSAPRASGDLAVLVVPRPAGFGPHWIRSVHTFEVEDGSLAWRIGKQGRWTPARSPGEYIGLQGNLLGYDHLDTPPGSSGGPIVTAQGIVGMVVNDAGALPSQVTPVDIIHQRVVSWQLPWNLREQPPSQGATASVPDGSAPVPGSGPVTGAAPDSVGSIPHLAPPFPQAFAPPPPEQRRLVPIDGRWTIGAVQDCGRRFYILTMSDGVLSFRDERNQVDIERITDVSPDGYETRTIASDHSDGHATPIGTAWRYRFVSPSEAQVINMRTGHPFTLRRCDQ